MSAPRPAQALWYLYARTTANRLRSQAARIRSPRYIAAVALGAFYLWWALFRNTRLGASPLTAGPRIGIVQLIVAALVLVSSARWWLFGGDRSALAFGQAEVQFLFPAPLTRRMLIHAKLLRMQFSILINTVIFSIIFRGGAWNLSAWERGFGLWLVFSTLALHRLGAALVRASAIEHDGAGRKRAVVPMVLFGALIFALAFGLFEQRAQLAAGAASGIPELLQDIVAALRAPVPSAALWPVHRLLAPVFTAGTSAWLAALPGALLLLLVHYVWVVRLDGAFEEAALEASQHRAERMQRFRASQMGQARSKSGKLARVPSLALRGRPEVAIAWKNVAAALRGGAWRTQLITFTVALGVLAMATEFASSRANDVFLGVAIGWVAMLLFLGPLWMRFDLRLDLPRLALLKTYPLPGWRIVVAEIAAVTGLHTITLWTLMAIPMIMVLRDPGAWHGPTVPTLVLTAFIAVPTFNALMFTIQNATALLFPAWVRLGSEARGFETMGQNLLTMGATTFVTAVALVFPAGIGALVWWLTGWQGWALPLAALLAALVVLAELLPVWRWLGTVFDGTDLSDVPAAT